MARTWATISKVRILVCRHSKKEYTVCKNKITQQTKITAANYFYGYKTNYKPSKTNI